MDHSPRSDLRSLLRSGLAKSLVSLAIKVATAGLTYLMYVIFSRSIGADEYGYFAFGLSVATVLAIGANYGQQTAILRYWPEEMVGGHADRARAALQSGGAITLLAGTAISLGLVIVAIGTGIAGAGPVAHLFAAATLILPLAFSEYWSAALRAQGSVWTGLVPRDIVWRAALPLAVVLIYAAGLALSGAAALILTAAVLVAALLLQVGLAHRNRYDILPGWQRLRAYWAEKGRASRSFFLGTVLDSAALNMDTIFVGLLVAPAVAGTYFNAFRTAGLLTLFMFAITLVVAPMVSQHYHAGEMKKAQAITALCAWAGFLFSLVVFAGFLVFGDHVIGLFGGSQHDAALLLVILSVGLLFDAATGPSRIVMMMTGHERAYVRIFGLAILVGMVVQVPVIMAYGALGAAVVNTLARVAAQLAIAIYSHRRIGLDTSLLGAFLVTSRRDRPPTTA